MITDLIAIAFPLVCLALVLGVYWWALFGEDA